MIKKGGQITYEERRDALIIRVGGEIDHHSAVNVRTEMDEKILAVRPSRVLLELSAVDFMDSSGLGLILGRYATVQKIKGELVVLNPNDRVMKILKLAGAERIIKIEHVDINAEKGKKRGVKNGK